MDVGQGDAWLLVTPRGRVLVDGGGSPDRAYEFGRLRLLPKLADLGAVSLDAVVLTHPHPDHARGLLAVLDSLPVGRVVLPRAAPRNAFLDEFLAVARKRRLVLERLGAGARFEAAGLAFDVLHPGDDPYPRARENNGSLVLRARAEGRTLLLTGDVESAAERDLVASGAGPPGRRPEGAAPREPHLDDAGLPLARRAARRARGRRPAQPVRPSRAGRRSAPRRGRRARLPDGPRRRPRPHARRGPHPPHVPGSRREVRAVSGPSGVLAILGATATGKSELAVALAERLGGEVVSADAFAVYRGFDVGTAKPGADLRARAPHHLVDAREPVEPWSAGEFAAEARRLCEEILARGRLPILAGGTGFYVRAFFGGLFEGPRRDDAVRAALEAVAARRGAPYLKRMVSVLDPEVASRLADADASRAIRLLEILLLSGERPSRLFRERPGRGVDAAVA